MQKLALIGCGVVGQGLLKILLDKGQMLKDKYGYEAQVVAVSDKFKGAVMCKDGIPLDKLLVHLEQKKPLGELAVEGATYGLDPVETIRQSNADVVVELSFTNVKTGEPAATFMREAFRSGKHVATTNKGPAALFYKELSQLAQENQVIYKIEGTVMSGTPVFSLIDYALAGNTVTGVKGILNGTTNFILTKMEMDNMPYPEALALAQELGYAEADPTADVEGFDALAKVLILSNVVLGASIKESDVDRDGITKITLDNIKEAKEKGLRYKLVASTRKEGGKIVASVKPLAIPLTDPLAGVMGATNALTFETDLMGPVTIQGAGAGKIETGFSVLIDLLTIHREAACCCDDESCGDDDCCCKK